MTSSHINIARGPNLNIPSLLMNLQKSRHMCCQIIIFQSPRFPRMPSIHCLINRARGPFHFPLASSSSSSSSRLLSRPKLRRHQPPSTASSQVTTSAWLDQRTPTHHHHPSASVSTHILIPQICIRVCFVHRCSSPFFVFSFSSSSFVIWTRYKTCAVAV